MMSGGVGPVPLHIEHVRNPRQGMPVRGGIVRAEGPKKIFPAQPLKNLRVSRDVIRVVEIDETIFQGWRVKSSGPRSEQNSEEDDDAAAGSRRQTWWIAIRIIERTRSARKIHRRTEA